MRPIFPVPTIPAVLPLREIKFEHTVAGARDLAVEREEERDGLLGLRIGRRGRNPRDRKAQLLGRGDVNPVEPGARQREVFDAEFSKRFEAQAIGVVVDENADRPPAVDRVCSLSGRDGIP